MYNSIDVRIRTLPKYWGNIIEMYISIKDTCAVLGICGLIFLIPQIMGM